MKSAATCESHCGGKGTGQVHRVEGGMEGQQSPRLKRCWQPEFEELSKQLKGSQSLYKSKRNTCVEGDLSRLTF